MLDVLLYFMELSYSVEHLRNADVCPKYVVWNIYLAVDYRVILQAPFCKDVIPLIQGSK